MPCSKKSWCEGLGKCLEFSDGRGKGIRVVTTMSMDTGKVGHTLAVLFSGDYKKKGVVLNFCPFCGTCLDKIHELVRVKVKTNAKIKKHR